VIIVVNMFTISIRQAEESLGLLDLGVAEVINHFTLSGGTLDNTDALLAYLKLIFVYL
jgi:hypothetical protein